MPFQCTQCNREFSLKSNLTRHLRVVHNVNVERADILPAAMDVYHYKCLEECNVSFRYNRDLRCHLKERHGINLVEMVLEFPNADEFNKWLHEEEINNCVQYVHLTATKKKSTGVETYYYECSRTGKRTLLDENSRKRKPRKHGTAKLNRGCTSQIIVNKLHDGTHSVNYFKTHYGHEIALEHLKLSKQDRGAIASKLLIGMSSSGVLNSVTKTEGDLKRINLLRRKDIVNIRKSFKISLKDGKLMNVDTINIDTFIMECSQEQYNPILFHKVNMFEREATCLIIMSKNQSEVLCYNDSNIVVINSTSLSKCDFELLTLFVVNDENDSFPAACMFTNKIDFNVCELFFTKIFEKVSNFNCRALITNCNEIYFDAWKKVTGQSPECFYNPLNIDLDWKLNLNRIFCSEAEVTKIKRKWVYDTLKILQNTLDESEFMENLEETLKLLDNDQDFEDFLKYFLKQFSYPKRWANFYRNMYKIPIKSLELTQDSLKLYLNEENENRFDKIFHNLIRYIRDETINFIIKIGNDRSIFVSENDKRHQLSSNRRFEVSHVSQSCWNIKEDKSTYVIHEHSRKKCCNLICTCCHICVHSFSCTCIDFFVNNIICEHIHYIYVTYLQSIVQDEGENSDDAGEEEIIIEVDNTEQNRETRDSLQSEILEKISVLSNNVTEIQSESTLRVILETVSGLCNLGNEGEREQSVIGDHSYL